MVGHPAPHGAEGLDEQVEGLDDGIGVVVADVGPDGGLAGGDPGHVPEAAGGQLQQGGVLLAHARRPGPSGWPRSGGARGRPPPPASRAGPAPGPPRWPRGRPGRCGPGCRRRGRWWRWGSGPRWRPRRARRRRPPRPTCSEPAMGWPPTKRGWSTEATSGPLTLPTSVMTASGFQSRRIQHAADDLGGGVDGGGHHDQVGVVVDPLGGQGPELDGPCRHPVGGVHAGHVPAPLAQAGTHRAADEAGPEDHGPWDGTRDAGADRPGRVGPVEGCRLSRGGRHGVPGRPRGRRGGCRPAAARCSRAA